MEDKIIMTGNVELTLRNKDGNIIDHRSVKNIIVNGGFDFICDVMGKAAQPADMSYTAVGTGTTAADVADTTLETHLVRVSNVYAHSTGAKTYTSTAEYAATVGTGALTESGLFNDATTGTMLNRVVFSVINKAADDVLNIVWTITLS